MIDQAGIGSHCPHFVKEGTCGAQMDPCANQMNEELGGNEPHTLPNFAYKAGREGKVEVSSIRAAAW